MRYWIIKIRDPETVNAVKNKEEFIFKDIYNFRMDIAKGDRVFLFFGGDKGTKDVDWDIGLAGYASVTQGPHNLYNIDGKKHVYYNLKLNPQLIFSNVVPTSLSQSSEWTDKMVGIRWLEANNSPDQAIGRLGDSKGSNKNHNHITNIRLLQLAVTYDNSLKEQIFNKNDFISNIRNVCTFVGDFKNIDPDKRPSVDDERCDIIRSSLINIKSNLDRYLVDIDLDIAIRTSYGKGKLGYIPHIVLIHPSQSTSKGIYVVILFELNGNGIVCGLAKSSSNEPEGLQLPPTQKISDMDGIEMIVDSARRGTANYNESVFNPKKFEKDDDFFDELDNHLKESLNQYCTYFVNEDETSEHDLSRQLEGFNLSHPLLEKFAVKNLIFDQQQKDAIERQIHGAISTGKHIIFSGPPGTGKTKLSKEVCDHYVGKNYQLTTATSEWSTFDTIGGYLPKKDGTVEFSPGILLSCFKKENENKNDWLIIDEINRSDIDKALGQFQSVLTKDNVTLPFESNEGKRIQILYSDENDTAKNIYNVRSDWRLIGSMNTFDKSTLYEMSYALQRRFVIIPVYGPSSTNINKELLNQYLKVWKLNLEDLIEDEKLITLWKILSEHRQLGPGIIHDFIDLLHGGVKLHEAICSIIVPQFDGDDSLPEIISKLEDSEIITSEDKSYIDSFLKEILIN